VLATASLVVLLALLSIWFLSAESRLGSILVRSSFDWSQVLANKPPLTNSPVIIAYIDLESHLEEKQNPTEPWSRALHAQLIRRLTAAGARAIVFDIVFDAPGNPADDRKLADAIRDSGRVILAGEARRSSRDRNVPGIEAIERLSVSAPAKPFLDAAAAWGLAIVRADEDFTVRNLFPAFPDVPEPSLALASAKFAGAATPSSDPLWVRYYGPPMTIPNVSYSAALHAEESRDDVFRDKIVLIGARPIAGIFNDRRDEFRNPLAWAGRREAFMPAVEVQATELLNLLRGEAFHRTSVVVELSVLGLSAVLLGWVLMRFRPLPAAGAAVAAEAMAIAVGGFVMPAHGLWFPWLIAAAFQIPAALAGSVLWQSLEWYRQKRRFEEQRRVDEARIREQAALIEKAQDAIVVQNIDGRFLYANPSAERLFGWTAAELQNGGTVPLLAKSEVHRAALDSGEWIGEIEQKSRDGRNLILSSRCTLIRDAGGQPKSFLFINTDVTEKKRLEAESLRAQRLESIGVLAGGMAHDLNNVLSPILMGLQLLQKQRQDEETRRMLSVMEANTHRGADLVKQVLLFSRGRDGEKELLSVGAQIREMECIVQHTFPKSINVAALVPADLWPVLGNATQLHQVLLNFCVNARDAMPHGGELTLAADNVELGAEEARELPNGTPGRFVMVIVSDTGGGIPPEVLPRIFEPFFTTKPPGQGTGLGLSTAARIVRQHGGFMNVKTEPGHGTTFEVYLPCASIAPTPESQRVAVADFPPGAGELVLVADDEQSVREMVSLALSAHGYRVLTAANGAEAVTLFGEHTDEIKLVLLDTDMPVMSGREAAAVLRAQAPAMPIVLMSGEVETASRAGQVHTLTKPFQLPDLLRAIVQHIPR